MIMRGIIIVVVIKVGWPCPNLCPLNPAHHWPLLFYNTDDEHVVSVSLHPSFYQLPRYFLYRLTSIIFHSDRLM